MSERLLQALDMIGPGDLVRYHGSLGTHHGLYRAYPCDCWRCKAKDAYGVPDARYQLLAACGQTDPAPHCVRRDSLTPARNTNPQQATSQTDSEHCRAEAPHQHCTAGPASSDPATHRGDPRPLPGEPPPVASRPNASGDQTAQQNPPTNPAPPPSQAQARCSPQHVRNPAHPGL